MADVNFDDFDGGYGTPAAGGEPARGRAWITIIGGLTSVALVVGLGVWGYQIAVRDVMGVPVVRALTGPMRVAPEVPGGEVAAYQGLSVNSIAAEGTAAPPAERLVLAPRPVDVALDDAAGLAAEAPPMVEAQMQGPLPALAVSALSTPADPATSDPAVSGPATSDPAANVLALADALASGATPLADAVPAVPDAVAGGVGRSLRPASRPADLPATAPGAAPLAVTEIDPATLAVGTQLVQLGAFDDAEAARKEWDKLAARFGELLAGKARVVQTAQSGGRSFVRLRVQGFEGGDDARRFCSALLAENAGCIPVAVR